MSRPSSTRVDPILAGLIGATVVVGGGLVAYGTSQSTDERPAPPPVVQREDAVTARALAVVQELASAGEDGTPSAPAAARLAAQASLRGKAVDPFRGSAKGAAGTAGRSAATAGAEAGGTGTGGTTATDATRGTATPGGPTGGAGSGGASGTSGTPGATGSDPAPGAATTGGSGSGTTGGSGTGATGGSGTGSPGGSGTGSPGASGAGPTGGSDTTTTPGGGVSGRPATPDPAGPTVEGMAEASRRQAARLRAEAERLRRLEAERLARAPAQVSLRVATPNGKRTRERLAVGTLLPNRAHAVVRVLRVARDNRVVTLRLRDGARLAGPQSPGTGCVLRVESSGQCRLIHVRAGKAAVIQGADVDGAPGPVTALRVLDVWRGDTRVFGR